MPPALVPADFEVPRGLLGSGFRLEPLGPEHNERDFEAWMSSIDHIRNTAGFPYGSWPSPMSLEDNLADLVRHASDFDERIGFTYSVLDGDDVIGCVYIYPTEAEGSGAGIRSWVRASRADLDGPLREAVSAWLDREWPFEAVEYARRG